MKSDDADFVMHLFAREIPEVANGSVEVKAIARRAGTRTKVAVKSTSNEVNSVATCVGHRGNRIKKIVIALNNESGEAAIGGGTGLEDVDIFSWNDDVSILVRNALQPYKLRDVVVDNEHCEVTVTVTETQLPRGAAVACDLNQHIELASEVCGYAIKAVHDN